MPKSSILNRVVLSALSITLIITTTCSAVGDSDFYSNNDILFFDENASYCNPSNSTIDSSLTGIERFKEAVRIYGETAMNMQRKYGTPWEVVIAQMQKESSTGTAGIAVSGATNNWLGITGEGDAGSWISSTGRKWARYSSVEASISDWAGGRVLRNGYYDTAFQYLDPNNYNLDSFLSEMLKSYAPNSDGNNEAAYKQDVLSFINGPIAEIRAEKNWPSSAEFAKNENINIGGQYPLGIKIEVEWDSASSCLLGAGNGNINKTAISLSWPDSTHSLYDPKPEYASALDNVGLTSYGDEYVRVGASCDAFVATVMRYSGVDKDYQCCGTSNQLQYLMSSPKYQEVENLSNTSNLQPGDIFVINGHTFIYVVLDDGTERVASASWGGRTADYASSVFFSDQYGKYRIFRFIGN